MYQIAPRMHYQYGMYLYETYTMPLSRQAQGRRSFAFLCFALGSGELTVPPPRSSMQHFLCMASAVWTVVPLSLPSLSFRLYGLKEILFSKAYATLLELPWDKASSTLHHGAIETFLHVAPSNHEVHLCAPLLEGLNSLPELVQLRLTKALFHVRLLLASTFKVLCRLVERFGQMSFRHNLRTPILS